MTHDILIVEFNVYGLDSHELDLTNMRFYN